MMYFFQVARCITCGLGKCDSTDLKEYTIYNNSELRGGSWSNAEWAHPTFLCCRELLWGPSGDKLSGVPSGV